MADTRSPGALGTEHHGGRIPPGITGRAFQFPGPIGSGAWNEAVNAAVARLGPPSAQQRAEAAVRRFAARSGAGVFKKILRADVAKGLLVRIYTPSAINQKGSSLCGPAALLFDLATRDPEGYVSYVISLYETGVGQIRNLRVEPGTDLKEYDPGQEVEASDWIALASLRDSENYFFDYQQASDEFAGITLPGELEDWFRKVGYAEVVNDARVIVDQEEANLQRADDFFRRGYRVCLFINSNMLNPSTQSNGSVTPDHWVVQTSRVITGTAAVGGEQKRTVSLRIYTWGEGHRAIPQAGVLTLDDFLDNYYGFVAAKY